MTTHLKTQSNSVILNHDYVLHEHEQANDFRDGIRLYCGLIVILAFILF